MPRDKADLLREYYLGRDARLGATVLVSACIPLAWVYGTAARWSRRLRRARARRLPVPVLSVGNVTCGGTGKTPTVEMLARDLRARGRTPAIVSRGYGAGAGGPGSYRPGVDGEPLHGNDEFLLLARSIPEVAHYQGRDRYAQGLAAIADGAEILILDDGFQHTRLARSFDFVLVDATFPFGGGRTLPAGLLREPLDTLGEADLLGITRCDQVGEVTLSTLQSYLRNRFPGIPQVTLSTTSVAWHGAGGAVAPVDALRGCRVLAFCGIGNPDGFRRQLHRAGVDVVELVGFRDHVRYTERDAERIRNRAAELGVDRVVTTQKDAVKVPEDWIPNLHSLRIEQRVKSGVEAYVAMLDAIETAVSSPGRS